MISRTTIVFIIGIVIFTYNISARCDTDNENKIESNSYFIETLSYYFSLAASLLKNIPEDDYCLESCDISTSIEEKKSEDDYCAYPKKVFELIKKRAIQRDKSNINLKKGWKIVPEKTHYSDHISGRLVDEQDIPRIAYTGKTAIYDSYLYTTCISREKGLELKAKANEEKELQANAQLEAMMGTNIFDRFEVQLDALIYGDSCYKGYGKLMEKQVIPVLQWYIKTNNDPDNSIQSFLKGEFKNTQIAERLRNFIKVFLEHDDLAFLQDMCVNILDYSSKSDLYSMWKEHKIKNIEILSNQ